MKRPSNASVDVFSGRETCFVDADSDCSFLPKEKMASRDLWDR